MSSFQQQLMGVIPSGLRDFLEGGSRRELLRKIDTTLLVFDNSVGHLESGRTRKLSSATQHLNLAGLVETSKALLGNERKEASILLLLPTTEFVASRESMPGVTRENLRSALNLQQENILPAYTGEAVMAINTASADLGQEHYSLWMSESRLNMIFDAFAAEDMFVAAIRPRVLCLNASSRAVAIIDNDARMSTAVMLSHGVVTAWQQVYQADLQQPEFAEQWRATLAALVDPVENSSIEDYLAGAETQANSEYSFFPQGALKARRRVEKGRNIVIAAAAVVALLFLASIPFIAQSIEFRGLAADLRLSREFSVDARTDQVVVVEFERDFGVITDFPQQRVREAMFKLQEILSPDQLSSLEISEGLVRIQGTSVDPQAILERLEQDPMFTQVVFSRATNNNRYFIDLQLSTVNFDAYMVRYFPDN